MTVGEFIVRAVVCVVSVALICDLLDLLKDVIITQIEYYKERNRTNETEGSDQARQERGE